MLVIIYNKNASVIKIWIWWLHLCEFDDKTYYDHNTCSIWVSGTQVQPNFCPPFEGLPYKEERLPSS